jgi:ribosomal protein L17
MSETIMVNGRECQFLKHGNAFAVWNSADCLDVMGRWVHWSRAEDVEFFSTEAAAREFARKTALRSQLAESQAIAQVQLESLKCRDRKIENQRAEINRLIKAADEAQRTSEWCQRQLAAEREKRAALVREWRANADERCDEVAQRLLRHCADQLEALDKEANDV